MSVTLPRGWRRTTPLHRFALVVLLLCVTASVVAAHLVPPHTPISVDAPSRSQHSTESPASPPPPPPPSDPHVLHQDTFSEERHRLQLQFEREQWQRLAQQEQARIDANHAVATVKDVMAKLSGAEARAQVVPDGHPDAAVSARTADHTWADWMPTTTTTPLEQSAYYYRAMEALYQHGNVSLFAARLHEGVEATGHGRMHYLLGVLYANGVAVPRSEPNAVLHFSFAALQGVPEAHLALAHRLEDTGTSPADSPLEQCTAALPHYREAADAVAMTYDGGINVEAHSAAWTHMAPPRAGGRPGGSSVASNGEVTDDADGIRLMEGSTPRAEALRIIQREQLTLVQLIVRSDDGDAQASLLLGLHHLRGSTPSRRNWQLAERYLHKAIAQSPSFIELYLRKAVAQSTAARISTDAYLTPVQIDLQDYLLGETKAGIAAATHGMNPPLTATTTTTTSTTGAAKDKDKKAGKTEAGKRLSPSGEVLPEPNSDHVIKAISVAAHAYGFLGRLYATGDVLSDDPRTRDFAKALSYFRRGIALEDCASLNGIGFLHAVGYLHGGRTDAEHVAYEAALAALPPPTTATKATAAAASTATPAASRVGSDFESATHYFRVGTTRGMCAMSAYNLAVMMLHGLDDGIVRRPEKSNAAHAAQQAKENPFVSHMAEDGLFVPSRDTVTKAKTLLTQAAGHGSVLALWQLGRLAERDGDCRQAVALYRRVASHGSWLHGDSATVPWSFALMEDWRDAMLKDTHTAPTSTGTALAADGVFAPAQYTDRAAQRRQLQREQHERLVAYQQTARVAGGQDRETFLRTLRQHTAGQQEADAHSSFAPPTASASSAPSRPVRRESASTGTAASRTPITHWLTRLLRWLLRFVMGWDRAWGDDGSGTAAADATDTAHVAEPRVNKPPTTPSPTPSPSGHSHPTTTENVATISSVIRPAVSPIVALIEGLALVETGFVDYYAAWRAVEVLEEGVQVPEDVYASLYALTADDDTTDDGTDAHTAVLVRDGWLDRADTRFSASDAVPAGAASVLDHETVLLQWRAPYAPVTTATASRPSTSRPVPHRLVSQREAKKLLLHDLLQRYVHAASNRMPREEAYMPRSSKTEGHAGKSSSRVGVEELVYARTVLTPRLGQTLPTALNRLGDFYYRGESSLLGVDTTLALQYYRAASALGHSQATFNAGMMLQLGLGNLAEDDSAGASSDSSSSSSSDVLPTLALSSDEAAALVAAHPLTRVLSVFRALPLIGPRAFGWVTRLEEAVTALLTVPPELVLLHTEARHNLHGPPSMDGWQETNDYLFMHVLHIFYRNPAMARRCDLHLAKRYYDTTTTLNPRARWASRVMLWTLEVQSWWLDTPYEDPPTPAPRRVDPFAVKPPRPRQAATTTAPVKNSEQAGTARTKPTTSPSSLSPAAASKMRIGGDKITIPPSHPRTRAVLAWLWSYVPSYRTAENVVLVGALGVMGISLYLLFS